MLSPGQKRGSCGHVMALFDNHQKCTRCRDKGVGDDPCVKKLDYQICKSFTPAQIHQLATPTYKERKERSEQKRAEGNASTTPTLVDPSEVTVKLAVTSLPLLILLQRRRSVRMALQGREHPFFDPGASTSVMSSEGTGDVATQLTATQPPLGVPGTEAGRDGVESATHPVQGPGTSTVLATQPLLVPGAGTATQPTQAPGAGPEILPAGVETTLHNQSPPIGQNSDVARESDSEAELDGEPSSPASIHCQGDLPDTATDQDLSEDANYRETIRGVRSFMNWHHIPDYPGL